MERRPVMRWRPAVTYLHATDAAASMCYRLIPAWYCACMAFTFRTDEEVEQALDELTKAEGLSRQEVIRRAVLERYERAGHARRVDVSADRMLERWGDVLDRLGSA